MSIELAQQTLQILDRGHYVGPDGTTVMLRGLIDAAREATILYRSDVLWQPTTLPSEEPKIEVTSESTVQAARRLVEREQLSEVLALNFASAKNPGGGFLRGARAQEEDLTYSSALYPCLLSQGEYYSANKACGSSYYTSHMIYSPNVPFFRDETFRLLQKPFPLSVLTAPAPNVRALREANREDAKTTVRVVATRVLKVLGIAAAHKHRNLVLGAWGCGVFGNDPEMVADAFYKALHLPSCSGHFDRVTFAVWDRNPETSANLRAFRAHFGQDTT